MRNAIVNSFQYFYQTNRKRFEIRRGKLIALILTLGLYSILFSGIVGYIYYMYLHNPPTELYGRDLFDAINLIVFGSLLVNLAFAAIIGIYHPFFVSDVELSILQRQYLEPDVLRLSTFYSNLMKSLLLVVFLFSSYLPILILGGLSWWHYIVSFIILVLTTLTIIILADILFFITSSIRRRIQNVDFLGSGTLWTGLIYFGPAVIIFYLFTENLLPSFSNSPIAPFVPILNNIVALSGFYMRSGVPTLSLLSLTGIIIQIPILFILSYLIGRNYPVYDDLSSSAIKFNRIKTMQNQLRELDMEELEYKENIDGTEFQFDSSTRAIIYNNYLALRRTKSGDTWLFQTLFVLPLAFVVLLIGLPPMGQVIISVAIFYLATNLSRVLIMIEEPTLFEQIAANKKRYNYVKLLNLIVLNLILISPLVLISPFVLISATIFAVIIYILSDFNFIKSKYGSIALIYLYFLLCGYFIFAPQLLF